MEMLEKRGEPIYKDKYSSFQEDLKKDIEKIKSERGTEIKSKERYNEPKQEKKKGNPIFNILDNLIPSRKPLPAINDEPAIGRYGGFTTQDVIAPIDLEVDFNTLQMGNYYFRTFFVSGYPRFVGPNWLSPIINFEHSLRISTFYYPVDSKAIL